MNTVRYKTKQRDLVLICIKTNKERHMTADEIFYQLNSEGNHVGRATIYRYLNMLESEGLVQKYIADNTACYQYIEESCKNHYHLKCSKCTKIIHIESQELDNIKSVIMHKYKFNVDNAKLILYGKCEECS